MVRPLGFLVGLGFITALVFAIFTTPTAALALETN